MSEGKHALRLPQPGTVLRLLNVPASRECLGVGFLDKSGRGPDCLDRRLPTYVLVLALRGRGSYVDSDGKTHGVGVGQAFQRFPWITHSNYVEADSAWFECYLSCGPQLCQALDAMGFLPDGAPVLDMPVGQGLLDRLVTYRDDLRAAGQAELPTMAGHFLELMAECRGGARPTSAPGLERPLREAMELLGKDFARPVDLRRFCRANGWGHETFRKAFQRATGMPPCRFRMVRRLEAAAALLHAPEVKVKDVAAELGYSSPYDFSSQFKKFFGVSPRSYRSGSAAGNR